MPRHCPGFGKMIQGDWTPIAIAQDNRVHLTLGERLTYCLATREVAIAYIPSPFSHNEDSVLVPGAQSHVSTPDILM